MMKFNRMCGAAGACLVCMTLALVGRADDAAPAPGKPTVVARFAVGSQTQVQSLADQLGVQLPAMLSASGVEGMFTFLGQGGFNPDLPFAIDVIAGADLTQAQRVLFYLPVTAGHAPIKDFLVTGEKLGDDGAIVNNSPFRRTGDYLLFGSTPEIIGAAKPDEMVTLVKNAIANGSDLADLAGRMKGPSGDR